MFRSFVAAIILVSCFTAAGWAQSPSTSSAPAASTPAKPVTKKAAPKTKAAAKQPVAETGPCQTWRHLRSWRSILRSEIRSHDIRERGKRSADERMGARRFAVRTGSRSDRRRSCRFDGSLILTGAFEPYYNPKSRFLPDPSEGLPAIVRGITANANCERYLVITKYNGAAAGHQNGDRLSRRSAHTVPGHPLFTATTLPSVRQCCGLACTTARRYEKSTGSPRRPLALSFAAGTRRCRKTRHCTASWTNRTLPNPPTSASGSTALNDKNARPRFGAT